MAANAAEIEREMFAFGNAAIGAVSLWRRADRADDAMKAAKRWLANESLPEFARMLLRAAVAELEGRS